MLWSIAHHMSGHEAEARKGYEELLEKNPRFAPAANNLAFMLAEKDEDLPRAFLLAQAARDAAPDDPQVADTLGWVLFKQRAYPRAEAILKEAAEKMPDNAEVFYHLGMAQQEMQRTDEARASFNRSLEIDSAGAYGDKARAALAGLGE
jgi:tetratricopeptide (TPR) repeat protein